MLYKILTTSAIACLIPIAPVDAAEYLLTYSGVGLHGYFEAGLTVDVDTATGEITHLVGGNHSGVNGGPVTGLSDFGAADNHLFLNAPWVTDSGISFSTAGIGGQPGATYKMFYWPPNSSFYEINSIDDPQGIISFDYGVSSITVQAYDGGGGAVPEPAVWAMMIVGMSAVGSVLRTRRGEGSRSAAA